MLVQLEAPCEAHSLSLMLAVSFLCSSCLFNGPVNQRHAQTSSEVAPLSVKLILSGPRTCLQIVPVVLTDFLTINILGSSFSLPVSWLPDSTHWINILNWIRAQRLIRKQMKALGLAGNSFYCALYLIRTRTHQISSRTRTHQISS